jgi:hypothetical protein
MLHGFGFSRRTYAEPGGWVCPFILAEVEQDQRSRVHFTELAPNRAEE